MLPQLEKRSTHKAVSGVLKNRKYTSEIWSGNLPPVERDSVHFGRNYATLSFLCVRNLVPRGLRLLGQRVGARRENGE